MKKLLFGMNVISGLGQISVECFRVQALELLDSPGLKFILAGRLSKPHV